MVCEHLRALEQELQTRGIAETFRGQAWSRNCREWVYFACYLDAPSIRARLNLPDCVEDHTNDDPRSGQERGLVCSEHHDAIVGRYEPSSAYPTIT
ncbi:MAG: hypothetical protein QM770_05480 [Tepidisphaeraceae bacterium]